jgi:predicted nucleic acid-binding protein
VTGWLLDTNVISELRKPRCDARCREWSEAQHPVMMFLSTVTIAEIRFGIERLPSGDTLRQRLEAWLAHDLRPWFADRVLDVDEEVILVWRRLVESGRARNYTFSQPDLFIAATGLVHGLCVVTRNLADFAEAEVPVLNPWTDEEVEAPKY